MTTYNSETDGTAPIEWFSAAGGSEQSAFSSILQLTYGVRRQEPVAPPQEQQPPAQQVQQVQAPEVAAPAVPLQAGADGEQLDYHAQRIQQQLNEIPQALRTNVVNWVEQLGSANPQERRNAIARLSEHPREGRIAFEAALQQPNSPVHRLITQLTSPDSTVQGNAIAALLPVSDAAGRQIANLMKNVPNNEFAQGLNRLVADLAAGNPQQDAASRERFTNAARTLDRLHLIVPSIVDRALQTQLSDPNSALSRNVQSLIGSLGSDSFQTRDFASRALAGIGPAVLPALETALRQPNLDLESRRRLESLVQSIPEQHPRRIVESMTQAGLEALPLTGNAQQDAARQENFRRLVSGVFHGSPDSILQALGNQNIGVDEKGRLQSTYQPSSTEEWRALAQGLQAALRSNPRTRDLMARVSPQGNFLLGFDQNESGPGSSLILVDRSMTFPNANPLSFRTVPLVQDPQAEVRMTIPPPPQTARETLHDLFIDPFADGLVARRQHTIEMPALPGVLPMQLQIPVWGPYIPRRAFSKQF